MGYALIRSKTLNSVSKDPCLLAGYRAKKELNIRARERTVRRKLLENNQKGYSPGKVLLLTKSHIDKRLMFARSQFRLDQGKIKKHSMDRREQNSFDW